MEAIFTYILKANLLLVLFYLIYKLALSKETFYHYSRWFLLSGMVVSVVLPFITITKVVYYEVKKVMTNPIENPASNVVSVSNEAIAQEPLFTTQELLLYAYGFITLLFLLKTFFDLFKLIKIIKFSHSEKKDKLVYINSSLVNTPFSFFNYIVFNSELIHPNELQNIMKHEEAHSLQKHSFDTLLAQFFIILFWFNPIVWLYRKCIVQNLEFLADSHAITQVSDKTYYQKTMLKITLQPQNMSIINQFNQSSIKKRIIMLNTNQSNRKNALKYAIVIPALIAFIMLFQVNVIAKERFSSSSHGTKSINANQKYIIQSSSTDSELKEYSNQLKKEYKIDLSIKGVKRNSDKEITAINVTLKDNNGKKAVHKVDGDEAIEPIYINVSKGKNDTYSFAIGINEENEDIGILLDENDHLDAISEIGDIDVEVEVGDIEVPEFPEGPVLDIDFPSPPEAPIMPNAPEAPANPNDKKAWAKFEKDMDVFEKNMKAKEGDWKKFEEEMKVFEEKMKSFEPQMEKFEKEMKIFEQKMELHGKKIEKRVEKQIRKEMKNSDFDNSKGSKGSKGEKGPKDVKIIKKIEIE